jgi:MYXO-CTERM domain-containing protein
MIRKHAISVAILSLPALAVFGCDQSDSAQDSVGVRVAALVSTPQKLAVNDSGLLGRSVSLFGDTALVGAIGAGGAYVFVRSGTTWTLQQKPGGGHTTSVSVFTDTAFVGSLSSDAVGPSATYVFVRSGTTWTQQQILSTGIDNDGFGGSSSLSANTALIGGGIGGGGRVYVYVKDGTGWTRQQELTASDGAVEHYFGSPVSLSGDSALIGAWGHESAYVFVRSGTTWTEQQRLTVTGGQFGSAVSLSGDTALVGDQAADRYTGAVYVYTRSGTVWTQQQKLTAMDGAVDDSFGTSVSLSGDTAIVGAAHDNGSPSGKAYVFARSGTTWSQRQKLKVNNGAVDEFGGSVSLFGNSALIGAGFEDNGSGAAYVFDLPGDGTLPADGAPTAKDGDGGDAVPTTKPADELAPRPAAGCSCGTAGDPSGNTHPWAAVLVGMLLATRRPRRARVDGENPDLYSSAARRSPE